MKPVPAIGSVQSMCRDIVWGDRLLAILATICSTSEDGIAAHWCDERHIFLLCVRGAPYGASRLLRTVARSGTSTAKSGVAPPAMLNIAGDPNCLLGREEIRSGKVAGEGAS